MKSMSIVAHNSSRIFGGGEIGTVLLLRGLQQRGHRVHMIVRDERVADRVRSYDVPVSVQRVGGDLMLPHAVLLAARLREHRPDAVILTTFKRVVLAGLGARLARVPFVVQRIVLEGDTPHRGRRYRYALRNFVDCVVLNAASMRDRFVEGDPALAKRVITITDGVDRPRTTGADVRAELGIPDTAYVVGSVARLARQKRFDRLIRALPLLPAHTHCIIAGEGEDESSLRALAHSLGVESRVHLVGFRRDVGDVMSSFDVFVVCSDREGMANAMLEAMWLGIPVVSTDVSGAREALDGTGGAGPAGIVIGFDDGELPSVLGSLHDDADRRRDLGSAAMQRAQTRFSADRFLDEWERLLATRPAKLT